MIRAAIVGLGRWGQTLVNSVQTDGNPLGPHIRFSYAAARSPQKAAAFLAQQRLRCQNFEDLLRAEDLDAVVLTTPHSLHAEQIRLAAEAGKHVFVEKPLTLDRPSAEASVKACRDAGVVLAVGHNRRFLPAMGDIKQMINSGDLGTVMHVEGNFSGSFGLNYSPGMWRASPGESPAGGMTAMGIHVVDAMIHLLGPLAGVQAISLRQVINCDIDDTTAVLLRFASGMTGYLGTLMATPRQWRLQVFGTQKWVHMRDHDIVDICALGGHPQTRRYAETDIERAELEAFAIAASGGPPYPIPLDEAVHGIAVQDAIVASTQRNGDYVEVQR